MSVQMKTVGQIDTDRAINSMKVYIADNFPKDVKVVIGGTALVEGSLNRLVVLSLGQQKPGGHQLRTITNKRIGTRL